MKFNKIMGVTSLILVIVFIISTVTFIVTATKRFGHPKYSLYTHFDRHFNNNVTVNDKDTLIISKEDVFSVSKNLLIDCTNEAIHIVEEDREDIYVEYYYESPKNQPYKIKTDSYEDKDTVYIKVKYTIERFNQLKGYEQSITIHIPNNHKFDTYKLEKDVGDVSDYSIPYAENVKIDVDAGKINVNYNYPLNELIIKANAGSVNITLEEPINDLTIDCDIGDLSLVTKDTCNNLKINSNAGSITLNAHDTVNHVDINSDFGEIVGNFYEKVAQLITEVDAGDITLNLLSNGDSTASIDVDLGSIICDLPQVNKSNEPDIIISANLGSVTVKTME